MGKYVNYYNGENTNIKFEFEDITSEDADRIQAYMLQDSHFIIHDEEILDKISEEKKEIDQLHNHTIGNISIKRDSKDRNHFLIDGIVENVEENQEKTGYRCHGNIYEGLNFFCIMGIRDELKTNFCYFSSINWYYDKLHNPKKLIRFNIKTPPVGIQQDKWDLEGDNREYPVSEEFDITDNPKVIFNSIKTRNKLKKKKKVG